MKSESFKSFKTYHLFLLLTLLGSVASGGCRTWSRCDTLFRRINFWFQIWISTYVRCARARGSRDFSAPHSLKPYGRYHGWFSSGGNILIRINLRCRSNFFSVMSKLHRMICICISFRSTVKTRGGKSRFRSCTSVFRNSTEKNKRRTTWTSYCYLQIKTIM